MTARRANKVDANQNEIVKALRAYGLSVQSLASVGAGCPDLLVGGNGINALLEVKVGGLKLNPEQLTWHSGWGGRVWVVNTVAGAYSICLKEGLLAGRCAVHSAHRPANG